MKQIFFYLTLGLTTILSGSVWAAPTSAELKVGITQEYETLNPIVKTMAATSYIFQMVGRAMVTLDENGHWVPQLVKSIPSLENKQAQLSADKKKITAIWELKDNAKWGDGQDITCEDFAFTREVAMNENVSTPNKETYSDIESITWDPKTPKKCVFVYAKPTWTFYQEADFHPIPYHLEKAVYDKYKDQKEGYEKNTLYSKDPTNPGLYDGPYRIFEVKLADHVTVVPNPYFYGKAPRIQKIQIKLIPNTGTLEANLRSGTIDAVSSLGFTFDQALNLEKKVKTDKLPFSVLFKPSTRYEHIDLNLENPFLKDIRVRKALVYAINRPELAKALFENKLEPAIHNVAPIDPWYTKNPKDIVLYNYDKKKAASLLEEAGWRLEGDGFRHKDGKKLSLIFMTTAGDKNREQVQVRLQSQWKAVGIDVNIKNEPARVLFGETMRKKNFGAMSLFGWASSPENSPRGQLHSQQIPSEKNGWSGQNFTSYSNPEMDKLLDQLDLEFNPKRRLELVSRILHLYTDEIPVIPLFYNADVAVNPLNLNGFHLTGHQFSESNHVENWEIK